MRIAPGPALLGLALCSACGEPEDTLFAPPPIPPAEIAPGLFRVTWHDGPDVVRGFTPDGQQIVYQSRDLPGFGVGWRVLTAGLADGAVREEAEAYRRGLIEPVGNVVVGGSDRLLITWRSEGLLTCPEPCPPAPPVIGLAIWRLPPTGVVPFSSLPQPRVSALPVSRTTNVFCFDDGPYLHHIRQRPAEGEVMDRRTNPYGPVERADASAGFYSDGETIWRYDPADPAAPADSLGPGAFPALSPDGRLLAVAVPVGLDSTMAQCASGLCCFQETITITLTSWQVVLYDVDAGGSAALGPGLEPVFDPLAARLAVRRPDALYWVDLGTGDASVIPGSEGGYAPAMSPDGSLLAFTASRFTSPDVFYLTLR
jgi:hypothetical protein